jgi:hypothetical protein
MKARRRIACLLGCLALSLPLGAQESKGARAPGPAVEPAVEPARDIDPANTGSSSAIDLSTKDSDSSSKDLRITLAHEISYRGPRESGVVNNRSWFRVEYSKFFMDSFYVHLDSKLNAYWSNDHRARAQDKRVLLETNTPEAFLQYSGAGGQTSLKVGQQRLIWGESEAGAITDLFLIPLEESRLGQFMVTLDRFTPGGDWTFFAVPRARFNKYPRARTAYDFDPFAGLADVRDESSRGKSHEYGMRWKKTFHGSDISFMAADLIDNDYAFRADGAGSEGRPLVSRLKQRFTLAGGTFNYARGKFLLKGEVAYKSPKPFNDASFRLIRKDVIDSALGLTYSLGQSDTVGLEIVNSHVLDWDDAIVGVPRNTNSLVLNTTLFFLNERLSANWLTVYRGPFTSLQSSLRTSYKWSDNTTFSVDAHLISARNRNSGLHRFHDQNQLVFRVEYKF